jgi:pSer/pThr/pTyr-binding forkhead associated (FHA) protein
VLELIIEDDEGHRTVVPLVRDELTIGRDQANTIHLAERNVSRRHARLVQREGQFLLEDLNSRNGIHLNGARVHGEVAVRVGDRIHVGDYELALVEAEQDGDPAESSRPSADASSERPATADALDTREESVPPPHTRRRPSLLTLVGAGTMLLGLAAAGAGALLLHSRPVPPLAQHTVAPAVGSPTGQAVPTPAPLATSGLAAPARPSPPALQGTGQASARPSAANIRATRYLESGTILFESGHYRQAAVNFGKCLEAEQDYATCHMMLGFTYGQLARLETGASRSTYLEREAFHSERFVELAPNHPRAAQVRAHLERSAQQRAAAP